MPVVEIHLLEGYSSGEKRRLGEALTDAVRFVIPAPPEAVTVMIREMREDGYMRGRIARHPAPANPDPGEIVRDFLAAMQDRDLDRACSFLGLGFEMQFPGADPMTRLQELIDWSASRYRFVTKSYAGFDAWQTEGDAAVVYCRGTLSGEWPDGTAFEGIRFMDRFEVQGGLIVKQEVWNDIAEVRARA